MLTPIFSAARGYDSVQIEYPGIASIFIDPENDKYSKFTISVAWHGDPPIFREVEISKTGFAIEIDANIRMNQG